MSAHLPDNSDSNLTYNDIKAEPCDIDAANYDNLSTTGLDSDDQLLENIDEIIRRAEETLRRSTAFRSQYTFARRPNPTDDNNTFNNLVLNENISPTRILNDLENDPTRILIPELMDEIQNIAVNVDSTVDISDTSDDEVIFMGFFENNCTEVIDLCSPAGAASIPRVRNRRANNICQPPNDTNLPVNGKSTSPPKKTPEISKKPRVSDPNIIKCPVCMDPITGRRPMSTVCGHVFCFDCITQAIKTTHKCPICVRKLSVKAVHPIYF